jgi:sensor histidine kinase YesM
VADTGVGISPKRLQEVQSALKEQRTAAIGIGIGNIYKRVHMMRKDGELRLYSREGIGTVVQVRVPQSVEKSLWKLQAAE